MEKFAKPGDFCPNEACPDHGKLQSDQQQNIEKFGKTSKGVQRYRCKTCRQTFTETIGTIFYRKRTPKHEILETLVLMAEDSRISSLSRAKGHKEDTILAWVREAAQHADKVEAVLMKDFKVKRGQLDALWAYVRHKGEKKLAEINRSEMIGVQSILKLEGGQLFPPSACAPSFVGLIPREITRQMPVMPKSHPTR